MIKGRFLTAANIISIIRIPLAGAAALMLHEGSRTMAALFIVLASVSDALDGHIARKTGTVSDWGKLLDPAADKIAFAVMAVTMVRMGLIPSWILWTLICRDGLIILGGLLMSTGARPPSANVWGKTATLLLAVYVFRQAIFPGLQLHENLFEGVDLIGLSSAVLIVVSFLSYVVVFFRSRGKQ